MGLFGNDKQQDKRLDALEEHVRKLTEAIQRNQLETVVLRVAMMDLQGQTSEKLDAKELDPATMALNEKLGKARVRLEEASRAASERWSALQEEVTVAIEELDAQVNAAEAKTTGS